MKKTLTILIVLLISMGLLAQTPEKWSYQAVVRGADNGLMANTEVGLEISIIQASPSGTVVYAETHSPLTNTNGLLSIEIGNGSVVSGNFADIDWSDGPYFLQTRTDPNGGTNYTITGVQQLLSVPFAFHANSAETVTGVLDELDPVFAESTAGGITETDTAYWNSKLDEEEDGDPTNELQMITLLGDTLLGLTNSGYFVTLPEETDPVYTANMAAGNSFLPPGMIVPYGGVSSNVPVGWLFCDGSAVNRAQYANLFAVLGTSYGEGDGSSTFNLPDMRGMFMRGVDNGSGNDPEAGSRIASNNGGNTGDNVGSLQTNATGMPVNFFEVDSTGDHMHTISIDNSGGHDHSANIQNDSHKHEHDFDVSPFGKIPPFGVAGLNVLVPNNGYYAHSEDTDYDTHKHMITIDTISDHSHSATIFNEGNHVHTISGGDAETRPVNVYVNYIIKY